MLIDAGLRDQRPVQALADYGLIFHGRDQARTDPEGRRPFLGALLLAYCDPNGRLVYAGRAGSGINTAKLQRLLRRLQPLAIEKMPLDVLPPRGSRFGSPLASAACIG
jgi:ATP dependent DNA ligase C terminal region